MTASLFCHGTEIVSNDPIHIQGKAPAPVVLKVRAVADNLGALWYSVHTGQAA